MKPIEDVKTYLAAALSLPLEIKPWEGMERLPPFLIDRFEFFESNIIGAPCLFLVDKLEGPPVPGVLSKQLAKAKEKWPGDIIYVNRILTSLIRKRLVESNIPFIAPGNQMYLPMLGVDFREHFRKAKDQREFFSPATQVLVLDAIYWRLKGAYSTKDAVHRLGYSTMTVNRAFDELAEVNLAENGSRGKERHVFFENPRKVWDSVLPRLRNPIRKKVSVTTPVEFQLTVMAGQSALAEYTDISEPAIPVMVEPPIWSGNAARWPAGESVLVEIWRYPPIASGMPKGKKRLVDPLSLYLSLADEADDRIEIAKRKLLEDVLW